jgi:deoxycytidine triphosphate deaminase
MEAEMAMDDLQDRWKWDDPDPDGEPGVLLSDRIQFYVEKVKLISPFDVESLAPASYTLHAGDEYWIDDEPQRPNAKSEIVVPKNGLIYLKIYEELNLPYYLIAQHDLKVKQVYRGFLAGRSLLIDPGYPGHIHYPIYNFTNQEKVIRLHEELISICFIKTTRFGTKEWRAKQYAETSGLGTVLPKVIGLNGYECLKFPAFRDRPLPEYWRQGEAHQSSVVALRQEVRGMRKSISRLRNVGFISLLAMIVALMGILLTFHYWVSGNVIAINKDMSSLRSSVERFQSEPTEFRTVAPRVNRPVDAPASAEPNTPADAGK